MVVTRKGGGFCRNLKIISVHETVEDVDETVELRVRVGKCAVQWCTWRFVLLNWVICGQAHEGLGRLGGNGD